MECCVPVRAAAGKLSRAVHRVPYRATLRSCSRLRGRQRKPAKNQARLTEKGLEHSMDLSFSENKQRY